MSDSKFNNMWALTGTSKEIFKLKEEEFSSSSSSSRIQMIRDIIVANGPYNVNGALLLLDRRTPNLSLQDFNITHVNLWVQIHNIPLEYFNEKYIRNVIQVAGEIITYDGNSEEVRGMHFARAKTIVARNSPLVAGSFSKTNEGFPRWVSFRYERVFRVCY
ncbi:hypothetical protein LIER_31905 [Lithospermum erythrorhizon]|uniref:DUF4283 domain-containing protein n=1 Tax=Lithospermum erythrorhizon TaxID=34254 RepID=A0AAV3RW49_LITER